MWITPLPVFFHTSFVLHFCYVNAVININVINIYAPNYKSASYAVAFFLVFILQVMSHYHLEAYLVTAS